ncbi:MAG: hypothetical protein AB7G28_15135 [Pirellulales bacterium]
MNLNRSGNRPICTGGHDVWHIAVVRKEHACWLWAEKLHAKISSIVFLAGRIDILQFVTDVAPATDTRG